MVTRLLFLMNYAKTTKISKILSNQKLVCIIFAYYRVSSMVHWKKRDFFTTVLLFTVKFLSKLTKVCSLISFQIWKKMLKTSAKTIFLFKQKRVNLTKKSNIYLNSVIFVIEFQQSNFVFISNFCSTELLMMPSDVHDFESQQTFSFDIFFNFFCLVNVFFFFHKRSFNSKTICLVKKFCKKYRLVWFIFFPPNEKFFKKN